MQGLEIFPGAISKLTKDLKSAARTLSAQEARYLVSAYYLLQENRKRFDNQLKALQTAELPFDLVKWLGESSRCLEKEMQVALDLYTENHPMGSWMRSVYGIGPVIAAGFLAHIKIERAPTVGHIWQFAGISGDKQRVWKKGEKRPFNAKLKTLCWKAGVSFMKFSNRKECLYGHLYHQRKAQEIAANEGLAFKAQADAALTRVAKTTEAYKYYVVGKLPPAHIDARARRWAVKQFLSDLHATWWPLATGTPAPLPYPIAILHHAHYRKPGEESWSQFDEVPDPEDE